MLIFFINYTQRISKISSKVRQKVTNNSSNSSFWSGEHVFVTILGEGLHVPELSVDWAKRCKEKLGDTGGVPFEYTLDGALRTGENNAKRGADTSNINDLEYADDLVVFETDPARFAEITNEFWMRRAKIGDRSYPSQKQNGCMCLRLSTTIASFPIFSFAQRRWSECTNFCIWVVSSEIATH